MTTEEIWLYTGMIGSLVAIIIVIAYLIIVSRRNKNREVPIQDERLVKIAEKSATIAFYIGLFTMSFLMIALIIGYEFFSIGNLDSINILMVEILIMAISYLCLYAYYSKKGTM